MNRWVLRRRRYRRWVGRRPSRKRAIRLTTVTAIGLVTYPVVSTVLGRIGFVAQILSPNGGLGSLVAALFGLGLVGLRLFLVFVAPPALACAWIHGLWPQPTVTVKTDLV